MCDNKRDTEEKIKVMQAYSKGKIIEVRNHEREEWRETPLPCWDWFECDYRVKPEVKKGYANLYRSCFGSVSVGTTFNNKEEALKYCINGYIKTIEFEYEDQ